jgi:hypothetical protein
VVRKGCVVRRAWGMALRCVADEDAPTSGYGRPDPKREGTWTKGREGMKQISPGRRPPAPTAAGETPRRNNRFPTASRCRGIRLFWG